MPEAALIRRPSVEASRRLPQSALLLRIAYSRCNRDRHRLSDLILHRENVSEFTIIAFGPDVVAGLGLDQLRGDADAVAGTSHGAFEYVAYTKVASDPFHIDGAALIGEAGIAGDHEQRRIARQRGDDLLNRAVREVFLLGVAAKIGEGHYRNRRLVGQRQRRSGRWQQLVDCGGG